MKQEQKETGPTINTNGTQLFDDIKLDELIYRVTGHRNQISKGDRCNESVRRVNTSGNKNDLIIKNKKYANNN